MSDLTVTLIGIITIYCGERPSVPIEPSNDPCLISKQVIVYIPDGRAGSAVCKEDDEANPRISPHFAYVRIRKARATPANWAGMPCAEDPPCAVFPLNGDTLEITGISSGSGFGGIPGIGGAHRQLRWSTHQPNLQLEPDPSRSITRMIVNNGTVYFRLKRRAWAARIIVPNVPGNRTIVAVNTAGVRSLVVPESAEIDIVNLPYPLVLGDLDEAYVDHSEHCDHFFLHYQLATAPPSRACNKPPDPECDTTSSQPHAGLTVSCSNSTYP